MKDRVFRILPPLLPLLILSALILAESTQDTPRFSARVDQIVVYAAVYDSEGQLVTGLTQEEFALFEDKIEQEVTSFTQTEVPSTIGIVLDSSGSMRNKMSMVEDALDLFLSQNNPQNELFLIRFDDEVELEEDFTRETEDVRDAIANVIVKGGTALYDAIYLSVDKAQSGLEPKKVAVVFTDGEDKDSYYSHEELIEKIREVDTQVFVVAFLDRDLSEDKGFFGIFKSQRQRVEHEITEIAEYTGGKAYFPEKVEELNGIFQSIAHELKNQYRLAYISSNPKRDGQWRRIDLRVEDARERGLKVRSKRGYYAPKGS
ncbi:MAG: VWA domain-containing protein [Acidobacteriota bacterium]|nr:MAG: VWA domain-containing protein [Acidobacteriota bacterium]